MPPLSRPMLLLITLSLLSYNNIKVSSVDVAADADSDNAVTEAVCQWPLLRCETPRGNRLLGTKASLT